MDGDLTMRKTLLFCLAVPFLVIVALVQTQGQEQSSTKSDDTNIRRTWQDYVAAWNKHDTKLLAAFLTEDVDRRTGDGRVSNGRTEALAGIEESFGVNRDTTLVSLQVDVRFLTHDVAILDA